MTHRGVERAKYGIQWARSSKCPEALLTATYPQEEAIRIYILPSILKVSTNG